MVTCVAVVLSLLAVLPGRALAACDAQTAIVDQYLTTAFLQQNPVAAGENFTTNDETFRFEWSSTTSSLENIGFKSTYNGKNALVEFFASALSTINSSSFSFADIYPTGAPLLLPGVNIITLATSCNVSNLPDIVVKQWAEDSSGGKAVQPVKEAVNTVVYTFNAAGTKIQRVQVFVETRKYLEAFGLPNNNEETPPSNQSGSSAGLSEQTITTVLEGVYISMYINLCFMVAEIAVLAWGPIGSRRETLDTLAHILAGPISFLGFLNGGFMGSLLFFLSLWHFLCDSGQSRPSLVRVCPRNCKEFWVWFESLWTLIHHIYIGAFKLLSTDLASQLEGVNTSQGPVRFLVRTWVGGATMSHLSFGMTSLGMQGALFFRVLSVFMRMGAASAIVAQYEGALRMAYIWDLCWMTVILSLTLRKELFSGKNESNVDTENPLEGHDHEDQANGGLKSRLVRRVRQQRRQTQMTRLKKGDYNKEANSAS